MKKSILSIIAVCLCLSASAQSSNFNLGKWTEIQNSIVRHLSRFYVDSLPSEKMFTASINAMLQELDPYTVFVPESQQEDFEMMISNTYGGIGAIIYKPKKDSYVVINEPYADSPAARSGLQCGDEIMEIDGQTVIGLDAGEASSRMKGKAGTEVVFKVKKVRSGDVVEYRITREKIHLPDVQYYGILEDGITGYIYQTGFTENVSEDVRHAVESLQKQGMKRLVLDLRGNGGGLMDEAIKIVSLFVPKGTLVVSSRGTDGTREYHTSTEPLDTRLPLMVLVDSGSASASEIVSGAIQDLDRGVVAGRRTYGKGLVQRIVPTAYNGQLKVTVSKYYTPSGRCVQAKDYSNRAEDGSVGNIPDSLIHEFKTAKGRTVKDGGGITPDIDAAAPAVNRISYAAVAGGLTNNWPIEYVRKHASIPAVADFHLSDEDYAEFVEWGAKEAFDIRSESETYYDLLVKQLKKDGDYEAAADALSALEKIVKMEKKDALMRNREVIQPVLEEEIATRYYYQPAAIQVRLRTDVQLQKALEQWK